MNQFLEIFIFSCITISDQRIKDVCNGKSTLTPEQLQNLKAFGLKCLN
ncbi:MAG: hypothetical protein WBN72_11435 [Nitrososphaeraceae archaeon]